MEKKLDSWKFAYIFKGGRLTLIQAVLSSLPTYYLSVFKTPSSIYKDIEKILWNFLWKGSDNCSGSHLVRWDIVTLPKEHGGLGIDRIKISNEALLCKWIWRYIKEKDSLWRNLIDAKYSCKHPKNIPDMCKYSSSKALWFHISKFENMLRNGNNTMCWLHPWNSDEKLYQVFPRFFALAMDKLINVADVWKEDSREWILTFRRPLLNHAKDLWNQISTNWM